MFNLFEFIENWGYHNADKLYGGYKDKNEMIRSTLNDHEREAYDNLRQSDRSRLLRFNS